VKRLALLFAALGVAMAIVGLTFTGDESLTDSQEVEAR
jgi:hypothetical protein